MAVSIVTPTNDNSRFELHSKVSSSVPKILVKSSHRGEIARWVQAIKLNIEYYGKTGRQASTSSATSPSSVAPARQGSISSENANSNATNTINTMPPTDHFLNSNLTSTTSGMSGTSLTTGRPAASSRKRNDIEDDNISIFEAADDRSILDNADQVGSAGVPHEGVFDMGVINIKTQLELTDQLVGSIFVPSGVVHSVEMTRTPSSQQAVKDALRNSLQTLSTLVSQQQVMTQDRERYLLGRIDREVEARRMWEENMLTVAKQQAETDKQLNEAARQNDRHRRALKQAKEVLGGIASSGSLPTSPFSEDAPGTAGSGIALQLPPNTAATTNTEGTFRSARSYRQSISISNVQEVAAALEDVDVGSDDEDEDEFFDAIETGALPNLRQYDSIANPDGARPGTPTTAEKQVEMVLPKVTKGTIQEYLARKSLEPYLHVRNRLPIDDDKRPSVSCELLVNHKHVVV